MIPTPNQRPDGCLITQFEDLPSEVRKDLITAIRLANDVVEETIFSYGSGCTFSPEEFQLTALLLQRLNAYARIMDDRKWI